MNKATAILIFTKEHLVAYGESAAEDIRRELAETLAKRLVQILDTPGEMIVKMSDVKSEEDPTREEIKFTRIIEWEPLIRCINCKYWLPSIGWNGDQYHYCSHPDYHEPNVNEDDFCKKAEKRKNEQVGQEAEK